MMKKLMAMLMVALLLALTAMPALAGHHRGARAGDTTIKRTKCTQQQAAAFRQIQRGDARSGRVSSAAAIKQKGKIKQRQVNACKRGIAAGRHLRLR